VASFVLLTFLAQHNDRFMHYEISMYFRLVTRLETQKMRELGRRKILILSVVMTWVEQTAKPHYNFSIELLSIMEIMHRNGLLTHVIIIL